MSLIVESPPPPSLVVVSLVVVSLVVVSLVVASLVVASLAVSLVATGARLLRQECHPWKSFCLKRPSPNI